MRSPGRGRGEGDLAAACAHGGGGSWRRVGRDLLPHGPHPSPFQFHPGADVGRGTDDTLFALKEGIVVFKTTRHERSVSVVDAETFVTPPGNVRAEVSRRTKRFAAHPPRAELRAAAAAAAVAAATVAP
jgi:hypothetical protein